ncbi:phosducin [Heteronotia binoei]|uniref:phosducin n=1 Tax=Heteronotia binoei TaxID=13085 RepID=UPI0029309383|nr:phosducin [Heteronotia binoei]
MEEQTSSSLEDDFEVHEASHTGPKGVIHDWRKFKLESEDKNTLSLSKKEILIRQMSSPHRSNNQSEARDRLIRKMSMQEYELINCEKEDETCLRKYRKRCMQDMHQRLSFGPKYGYLFELRSGEQFLETIEKERKTTTIIVHIYEDGVKGCDSLNNSLTCLAAEYCMVRFCKIKASDTGAGDRFSSDVLPTLLVYRGGELVSNFLSVTEQFSEEFFAVDVETFLKEYGLLPQKEIPALGNGNIEEKELE